jgi:hypothetical protein
MFSDTFPVVETIGYIGKTDAKKKHSLRFQPQERKENRQR